MASWNMDFPDLVKTGYQITSAPTISYNCIAWAMGDQTRWWWPDALCQYYWPNNVARTESIESFSEAFSLQGYTKCENGDHEDGIEKVALYGIFGLPTHAARQLPNGEWTSKLGGDHDITHHTLEGLYGPAYGYVLQFYCKEQV